MILSKNYAHRYQTCNSITMYMNDFGKSLLKRDKIAMSNKTIHPTDKMKIRLEHHNNQRWNEFLQA